MDNSSRFTAHLDREKNRCFSISSSVRTRNGIPSLVTSTAEASNSLCEPVTSFESENIKRITTINQFSARYSIRHERATTENDISVSTSDNENASVNPNIEGESIQGQPPSEASSRASKLSVVPTTSRFPRYIRRDQGIEQNLSEQQQLSEMLKRCSSLFNQLKETPLVNRKFRAVHLLHEKRSFGLMTAIIKRRIQDGTWSYECLPFGCIFWQYSVSPPRCVCVTISIEKEVVNDNSEVSFCFVCSCNPARVVRNSSERNICYHLTEVMSDNPICNLFKVILNDQFQSQPSTQFFGDILTLSDAYPTVCLLMDGISLEKRRKKRKYKIFYIQFDTDRSLFVPIIGK